MRLFMTYRIIIDTDFLYGLFISSDPNHNRANEIMSKIHNQNLIITSLVKYELITLISRRENQKRALEILEELMTVEFREYFIDQKDDEILLKEFQSHTTKNISTVNCGNLVIAKKLKAKIASFDKFYPAEYLVNPDLAQ
jgi:predicted nucleic acid-binding protein